MAKECGQGIQGCGGGIMWIFNLPKDSLQRSNAQIDPGFILDFGSQLLKIKVTPPRCRPPLKLFLNLGNTSIY